jgi:biotin operon repressor
VLVLDTDHLTELGCATHSGQRLADRLEKSDAAIAITIVSAEEQLRGWLARIAKAKAVEE